MSLDKVGEVEGLRLSGVSIKDLLSSEFINNIEELKINLDAVSLVLIKEDGREDNKQIIPFVLNHQNPQEVKEKILHVHGGKEKELEDLSKAIKKTIK